MLRRFSNVQGRRIGSNGTIYGDSSICRMTGELVGGVDKSPHTRQHELHRPRIGLPGGARLDVAYWIGGFVGDIVGDDVGFLVGDMVGAEVGGLVGEWVGRNVGDTVGELVGRKVGDIVGFLVGLNVGDIVGFVVGDFVPIFIVAGKLVGDIVGCFVGFVVGDIVGFFVGFIVGDFVGFTGAFVGAVGTGGGIARRYKFQLFTIRFRCRGVKLFMHVSTE
jgi:hypothetical protein